MRVEIFFTIGILLLVSGNINASRRSQKNAEDLIQGICDQLFEENLHSEENQQWEKLCQNWFKHQQRHEMQSENDIDESYMNDNYQPRLFRSRSGSRGGSSRSSSSRTSSRSSRSSSSRTSRSSSHTSSGSRTSSRIGYRSTRTGTFISRPTGSLWSRSRYSFLPVSRHYYYRSHSSTNRYSTPATGSGTYYYCSSNSSVLMEIQCSTINGDGQCCEDETTHEVFCCGGQISDDLVEDFSQATKLLARIFYTLSAIALVMHILIRRFYQ